MNSSPKVRLLSTVMMLGMLLGSMIGGRVGDRIGRKKSMFAAVAVVVPAVAAGGFVKGYIEYLILRLLTCTALPVIWVTFQVRSIVLK